MGIVNHLGGEFRFYSNVKGEKKAEGQENLGWLLVDFSPFFGQIFRTRKYLNVVENGKNVLGWRMVLSRLQTIGYRN